jgi:recombination protein RecA
MADKDEKKKNLEATITQIDRQYGKGSIMWMGEKRVTDDVRVIPTGSISLDYALGVGGIPRGRSIEIFGPEASGKTTLGIHLVNETQKAGGYTAFIDAEHAFPVDYAENIGVNLEDMLISQPDTGEQALDITEHLIRSGALDVVIIDSVAALVPRAELEGEMGDSHVGLQARLMSQALRRLTSAINRSNTICVFINQIREKIGTYFGNPETTPGGRALKFYSSIRLDIRRIGSIKSGDEHIGNRTRVRVVKNKLAAPFQSAEFDIIYGEGISREGEILDIGDELGIVEKSGSWYSYNDTRLGQGRENARIFLKENLDINLKLENLIREELKLPLIEKEKSVIKEEDEVENDEGEDSDNKNEELL